jgi:Secretion system C-terminal sorting domain
VYYSVGGVVGIEEGSSFFRVNLLLYQKNNQKMKKIILASALLVSAALNSHAQMRYFCYDESGNRTSRKTIGCNVIEPSKPGPGPVVMRETNAAAFNPALLYPNLTTPDGVVTNPSTGTTHIIGNATLYPNPTTGVLRVEFDEASTMTYQLFDMTGRLIRAGEAEATQRFMLDITQQINGLYMLRIQIKDEPMPHTWQIMKQ